jgi:hypothetical protein
VLSTKLEFIVRLHDAARGYFATAACAAATSWSVPCLRRALASATAFASVKRQAESTLLDAT